ncbi:MAG: hypothetical protein AAGA02_11985 [Bacteroidota bacterium]
MNRFHACYLFVIANLIFSCSSDPDPDIDCSNLNLSLSRIQVVDPSSCLSLDGSVQVVAMGFTGPLEYRANNGAPNETGLFTNLGSGEYNISVSDANNCSLSVLVTLDSPDSTVSILSVNSSFSGCESNTGSIEVVAEGGPNLSYSLDGIVFQEAGVFENVSAGTYNVTVRDDVCQDVQEHVVLSGVSFSKEIETIISSNCAISGCHVAGTGRVDFSVFSNIQSEAENIKSRTQNGSMPPGGRSISQEQIALISCWVNDGALNN